MNRFLHLVAALALLAGAAQANTSLWSKQFPKNDFENAVIDPGEITDVIGRDQIPAVHDPNHLRAENETRIDDREHVLTLEMDGATPRAYPIRYLMFHDIANDEVGGVPVAVTYCPLCNSGVVFDRRVDGQVLSFGVSGKLRHSDMVMYDLQTESFWQQAVGKGIIGRYAGTELRQLPAWMESWGEFRTRNPDGLVIEPPQPGGRYGSNPYARYDSRDRPIAHFYNGEDPPHGIPALMRVVRVGDRAWTLGRLRKESPLIEAGVKITWKAGQASALDSSVIAQGRDVGTIRVHDAATGKNMPHDVMFAFAFHSFWPEGTWMLGD